MVFTQKKMSFYQMVILICFLTFMSGCTKKKSSDTPNTTIVLRFIKSHEEHSVEKAIVGLKWAMSFLGAKNLNNDAVQISGDKIWLNCESLGLDNLAVSQLILLNTKFKSTDDYKRFQSIDLGRFIAMLMGASEHYYAIVNQPKTLTDLLSQYEMNEKKGYVDKSGVSLKDRIISFSDQVALNQLFVAEEVDEVTGELIEFETVDIMANGQLRFGIYNANGDLINSTDPKVSNAGKPAKCIWCHESKIQPIFVPQNDYPGYLTSQMLTDTIDYFRNQLSDKQSLLTSGVNFSALQEHTETEVEYIAFMEPSVERLMIEWQMSEKQVLKLTDGLKTHQHPEFSFLGELFDRADIETISPYQSLGVSSSIREFAEVEVNHLE